MVRFKPDTHDIASDLRPQPCGRLVDGPAQGERVAEQVERTQGLRPR